MLKQDKLRAAHKLFTDAARANAGDRALYDGLAHMADAFASFDVRIKMIEDKLDRLLALAEERRPNAIPR